MCSQPSNKDLFWKQDFHPFLIKPIGWMFAYFCRTHLSVRKSEGGVGPTVGVEDAT